MFYMPKIELDLDKDLYINESKELDIKIAPNSSLTIRDDGLYSSATDGVDGGSGNGYKTQSGVEGLIIGYSSLYGSIDDSGKIIATNIVHRVYTSLKDDGSELVDMREIDYVFPGDMYRVKNDDDTYTYYLVTGSNHNDGNPGNNVTSSVKLGSW